MATATPTTVFNKFKALEVEGDLDVTFKIDDVVENAMQHVPGNGANKGLVGDIVKAVVAALLPSLQSLAAQLKQVPVAGKVKAAVVEHDRRLTELEQYSRRDNIVIRGVPEREEAEDTSAIVVEVAKTEGVEISVGDISTSHRVGRKSQTMQAKPRPIVARFVRRDVRTKILRQKRKLNESESHRGVYVTEHLAPGRVKLFHAVKNDEKTEKVWTIDGKVFCTLKGSDRKHTIVGPDDLFRHLGWSEERLTGSGLFVDV